jgi:serpin B
MQHFNRIIILVSLSLIVGAQAAACAPSAAPVAMAQSDKPRQTAPAVSDAVRAQLHNGNRAFAFDLYRAVGDEPGNLFFSPYSLSTALAMAYAGARGTTERQMADVLHFGMPPDQLHPAFNALDLALTQTGGPFTLTTANSPWAQRDYKFLSAYLDTLAVNYGAGVRLVDFQSDAAREEARVTINRWVSDQTQGKIEELLEKGLLTDLTRLVLTNAIYFNADWAEPFNHDSTYDGKFTRLDGAQVMVPMMHRRGVLIYGAGADFEAVELPYQGGRMALVAVLPAEGQFEAYEAALDAERVDEVLRSLKAEADMILDLPKFQYSASLSLKEALTALGMPDAFDEQKADFSGMDGTRDLHIAHVIHKAFVAVDEKGTEAAAASGVFSEIVSLPPTIQFNRPFIFFIYDKQTGAILFVGRVLDPTVK